MTVMSAVGLVHSSAEQHQQVSGRRHPPRQKELRRARRGVGQAPTWLVLTLGRKFRESGTKEEGH